MTVSDSKNFMIVSIISQFITRQTLKDADIRLVSMDFSVIVKTVGSNTSPTIKDVLSSFANGIKNNAIKPK
jgi:hypothetical protein